MVIYIIVGKIVFENQARFRELSKIASRNQANLAAAAVAAGADPSILEQGFGSRATDVTATSRSCGSHASPAQCKAASCTVKVEASSRGSRGSRFRRSKEKKEVSSADRAAWSYLKCALLFFTAMVITWVCLLPSILICFLWTLPCLPTSTIIPPHPTSHCLDFSLFIQVC